MLRNKLFTPTTSDSDNLELRRQQRSEKTFWSTNELRERFGYRRVDYLRKHMDAIGIPYLEGQHGPFIDTGLLRWRGKGVTLASKEVSDEKRQDQKRLLHLPQTG